MSDPRKRNNPRYSDGPSHSKPKFDFSTVAGHRFLIPSMAARNIIGKGGEVIKRLRAQYSNRIMVPDSSGPERMFIVEADNDIVVDVWNDIIPLIKEFINAKECDFKTSDNNKQIEDDNEVDIRMIVHESQAGALIGKGGERIRHLIDSHKMTIIKIYHSLCPQSTDRIVRLVSTPENIVECLRSMLKYLENQILKGQRSNFDPNNYDESIAHTYGGYLNKYSRIKPENKAAVSHRGNDNYSDYEPRHSVFQRVSPIQYDNNAAYFGGSRNSTHNPQNNDYYEDVMRLSATNDVQRHVSRLVIPIHLVTAIIGTDGHRLSDIKRDSGAQVHLDEDRFNDREELFLIRGTEDQIYKAQCLIQLCARKYGDMGSFGY